MVAAAAAAACADPQPIQITYGTEIPTGFQCTDADGELLGLRAVDDGFARLTLVVDFVTLGGVPGCHPGELSQWCADPAHVCEPSLPQRFCHQMDPIPISSLTEAEAEFGRQISALDGSLITADAPDEPVIVRLVVTAEPCDAIDGELDLDLLIGCLTSCPVQLDEVNGDVFLGSPTLGDCRLEDVVACATNFVM